MDDMKFKVGDWCIDTRDNKLKQVLNPEAPVVGVYYKLWQPEAGEYVWFWKMHNKELLYMFGKFSHHNEFGYIIDEDDNGSIFTSKLRYWDNCEPFIGQLPSFIKENK